MVTLSANDQVSGVINNITGQLDRGLTGSLTRATLGANLMTKAISTGLDSLSNLIDGVGNKLRESMSIQQQNISTAGTLMQMTGMSFNEAGQFIDDFSEKMSKVAATLPGSTSQYVAMGKGIMDNLLPAFKSLNGELDLEGYKEALEVITQGSTFLAAANGVDVNLARLGVSKFLGGSSLSELQRLKFFEANPALLSRIEEEAGKLGKDLSKLTARDRADLLRTVLELPEEVIKASSNSISGLIEGFNSSLFDPQSGLFGLLRKLDPEGNTVINTVNQFLVEVLGDDGILTNLSKTLKILGVKFKDPMKLINDVLVNITDNIRGLNKIFKDFNISRSFVRLRSQLFSWLERMFDVRAIGRVTSDIVNSFIRFLADVFDWNAFFSGIGKTLADIINGAFDSIGNFDFAAVGRLAIRLVTGFIQGIFKFITSLDYLGAIGNLVKGAIKLITAPILAVIQVLTQDFIRFFRDILDIFFTPIREFFSGVVNLIRNIWGVITTTVDTLLNWVINTVDNLTSKFRDLGNSSNTTNNDSDVKEPGTAYSGFNYQGLMSAANREINNAPIGSELILANSSEAILNRKQQSTLLSALNLKGVNNTPKQVVRESKPNLTINTLNITTQGNNPQEVTTDIIKQVMVGIADEYAKFTQNNIVAPVA